MILCTDYCLQPSTCQDLVQWSLWPVGGAARSDATKKHSAGHYCGHSLWPVSGRPHQTLPEKPDRSLERTERTLDRPAEEHDRVAHDKCPWNKTRNQTDKRQKITQISLHEVTERNKLNQEQKTLKTSRKETDLKIPVNIQVSNLRCEWSQVWVISGLIDVRCEWSQVW